MIASANVYGAAVGALIAVFLIRRVSWRVAATVALLGLIVIDLLSTPSFRSSASPRCEPATELSADYWSASRSG
ncbi:hypothetical protein [Sphingopyxis terrae]|uniref:hypothetical protein n=1 Tax=Sphingopyxis terrae TaxID=33052 RepID=UPI00362D5433